MTEDEWDATGEGRAVNSFLKYTMSLSMVWAGATVGQLLPRALKALGTSALDNPDSWLKRGVKREILDSLANEAKYVRMLDPDHDEAVRHSLVVIGACSAIEGCIENTAKNVIRSTPTILDDTNYSASAIAQKYSLTEPSKILDKQWRRIENTAGRELSFCERFEAKMDVIGRSGDVPPVISQTFDTTYAIRNVWAHNAGYADPNFLASAPTLQYSLGDLVALTDDKSKGVQSSYYLAAVMLYGMIVANRGRALHGLDPIALKGKPAETDVGRSYVALYA